MSIRTITTKVDLGARQSAVSMFTAGYSVTTIQQLLKEEDIIVMKRSLHWGDLWTYSDFYITTGI